MIRNTFKLINPSFNKLLYSNYINIKNKYQIRNFSISNIIKNKEYTETGEWLLKENDIYKIGLTENSANELGELVYMEFNTLVDESADESVDLVIIESVKASASIIAPFECVVVENNEEIVNELNNINENPECEESSWLVKIRKV